MWLSGEELLRLRTDFYQFFQLSLSSWLKCRRINFGSWLLDKMRPFVGLSATMFRNEMSDDLPKQAEKRDDSSKAEHKPKTFGEPFIIPDESEGPFEQAPARPDQRPSENLPEP
jgi:hypothetical protein